MTGTGVAGTHSSNGQGEEVGALKLGGGGRATSAAADERAGPPRRPAGPSTRLAAIVVAIAAIVTLAGAIASALVGGTATTVPSAGPRTAKGAPLRATAARPELSSMISEGLPPSDILASLAFPRGTRHVPGSTVSTGLGDYDYSADFSVPASEKDVIEFFRAQLPFERWTQISKGLPSNGIGYEIIAQHPGSDGYEWEVGVTVKPETFSSSAGAATTVATTPFTVQLFQESDDQ